MSKKVEDLLEYWAPLNIPCATSGEKIFCQFKQKVARVVHPMRRLFVTNDRKYSANSWCAGFLEVPYSYHTKADRRSTFYTAKLPDLQDVQVEKAENFEKKRRVYIKPERKVADCPCCREEASKIHDYRTPFTSEFAKGCNNKIKVLK